MTPKAPTEPTALELYYNGNYVARLREFEYFTYKNKLYNIYVPRELVSEVVESSLIWS